MKSAVNCAMVLEVVAPSTHELAKIEERRLLTLRRAGVVAIRLVASLASVAAITLIGCRLIPVNATTIGFGYLVDILVIATAWGLLESTVSSIVATLCLNYFFFPPVGTFTIADPQNWVALSAFLATSIIASELSAHARRRTREAVDRQREMEKLYALSRAILLTDINDTATKQIAQQIAQAFEFPAVALYDRRSGDIHQAGARDLPGVEDKLWKAATEGTLFRDQTSGVIVTSIRLGGDPIGSLAVPGASLSDTALQSLSNLVAIGLERVRATEAANRAEAARQSEELKSALLDGIAHEFKTPLTSIKAATTALLSDGAPKTPAQQELLTIADEQADRLARLVTEAIEMARIEGGRLQLSREPRSAHSLISAALERMKPLTEGRRTDVQVPDGLPLVFVDAQLIQLALCQVIDNAIKYSSPTGSLTIRARAEPSNVVISLADQGPGIPREEQAKIFEKFYRSPSTRRRVAGSGMGLTIAREILRAHGGNISVESTPRVGSEFSLMLPLAPQEKRT